MKSKRRTILIALGLFLAVVLLIDFNRRMEELNRLSTNLVSVQAEGTAVMQTQAALVTQVAYATSDDAVKQWAYENKWVRTGEHPVQLVPAGGASPTVEPTPAPQAENPPNCCSLWWTPRRSAS